MIPERRHVPLWPLYALVVFLPVIALWLSTVRP